MELDTDHVVPIGAEELLNVLTQPAMAVHYWRSMLFPIFEPHPFSNVLSLLSLPSSFKPMYAQNYFFFLFIFYLLDVFDVM